MENARARMLHLSRLVGQIYRRLDGDTSRGGNPSRASHLDFVLASSIARTILPSPTTLTKIAFSHARRTRSPGWESELYRSRAGTSAERAHGGYVRQRVCFLTLTARRSSGLSVGVHAIDPTERSRFCIAEPFEKGTFATGAVLFSPFFLSRRETIPPIATRNRDLGAHERKKITAHDVYSRIASG